MAVTSLTKVDAIPLTTRAHRAIKHDNIVYIGDLIQKTRAELLCAPMTGPATVNEIEAELAKHGLALDTFDPAWPPANIEAALAS